MEVTILLNKKQQCWPLVAILALCSKVSSGIFAHQLCAATRLCWLPVGLRLPHPGEGARREPAPDPHTIPWDAPRHGGITFPLPPAPPSGTDWLLILAPAQEGVHGQDPTCCYCTEITLAPHIRLPAEEWPIWRRAIREHWAQPSAAEAECTIAMQQQ